MKEKIRKLPFRKKLLYSYLILLFLFAAGIIFYTVQQTHRLMQMDMDYMDQANQQMNLTLEMVEDNAENLRYLHFADETMRTILMRTGENFTQEEQWEAGAYIRNFLAVETDLDVYLLRATIETADGRVYQSLVADEDSYLERMRELAGQQEWTDTSQVFYTDVYSLEINMVSYETVTMITPVYDTSQKEPIGMLYVDLDFGVLKQQMNQMRQGSDTPAHFAILNQKKVLYHSADQAEDDPLNLDAEQLYQVLAAIVEQDGRDSNLEIDRRNCSVSVEYNEKTGWILLQYRPKSDLVMGILPDVLQMIGISVALWLLLLFVELAFVEQISRPVRLLSEVMGKVGQVKEGEVPVIDEKENVWEDEFGLLVTSYNQMASRINENIIRSYMAELEQKRTELKMLQFQINPHFLYNALNTISSIAVLENVDYIPQIANSLSEMFRYNIKGKNVVQIREELRQMGNYLQIQNIRFPNRFEIEIDVPEEVRECEIIKFVLQPVVENSIHHGFTEHRKKDRLKITGSREGDEVFLVVEDNGCGMKKEKVMELKQRLESGKISELTENAKSIGLSNVNVRLKNFYGKECGIRVESQPGEFTKIILHIRVMAQKTGG